MKSIILLAARVKSKRLPKKVLLDIVGKPMILHEIERLQLARIPREVILCTSTHPDDKVLIDLAKEVGIEWFAGSENDVLERFIQAAEIFRANVVIRATGDNPLTDPQYIDKVLQAWQKEKPDYIFIEGLPRGTKSELITLEALKRCRTIAINPEYSEYMSLYFRDSGFFQINKVTAEPEVYRPSYRLTVDTPEDLALIREIYQKLYQKDKYFPLVDVIKLLDANPKLVELNRKVKPKKVKLEIEGGKMRIVEEVNEES
jgi:spore coat polysaccharide biosynthesis protein SpsF